MKDYEHRALVDDLGISLREVNKSSLQGDELMLGLIRGRIDHHESALGIAMMVGLAGQALSRTAQVVELPITPVPETLAA